MAYTTTAIVRAESAFKNDTNISDAYVTRAIAESDSLIDGKIGTVYALPLTETPAIIQDISTTLTICNLTRDQNLNVEIADGVNLEEMCEAALAMLNDIMARRQKLIASDGTELPLTSRAKPSGYPTQASTDDGDTEPLSTIDQQF